MLRMFYKLVVMSVVVALSACITSPSAEQDSHNIDNSGPIRFELKNQSRLRPGDLNEFTAVVTSQVDLEDVIFKVLSNKELILCEGQLQWQGALRARQEKLLKFSCFIPKNAQSSLEAQLTSRQSGSKPIQSHAFLSVKQNAQRMFSATETIQNQKEQARDIRDFFVK